MICVYDLNVFFMKRMLCDLEWRVSWLMRASPYPAGWERGTLNWWLSFLWATAAVWPTLVYVSICHPKNGLRKSFFSICFGNTLPRRYRLCCPRSQHLHSPSSIYHIQLYGELQPCQTLLQQSQRNCKCTSVYSLFLL